jgi:hypothetical protein
MIDPPDRLVPLGNVSNWCLTENRSARCRESRPRNRAGLGAKGDAEPLPNPRDDANTPAIAIRDAFIDTFVVRRGNGLFVE